MLRGRRLDRRRDRRHDRGRQPSDRRGPGDRAEDGPGRNPAGDRGGRGGLPGVAREDRQGTGRHPAALVRPDDGEPGRPRRDHDGRARQAARRIEGRDRLCGLLHRVVRRGGEAHLRRHHPGAWRGQAHRRHQAADRRLRRDHALELPGRDDHPQGRAGARGRLHHGAETRVANPVLGACPLRACRAGRGAEGRLLPA